MSPPADGAAAFTPTARSKARRRPQRDPLRQLLFEQAQDGIVVFDQEGICVDVNPALTQSLLGHVKQLREDGRTVLFVEHDMDMVHDISDWVIVMGQGRVIAEGTPDAVMADRRVIDAYLGEHHDGAEKTVDGVELSADGAQPPPGAGGSVAAQDGTPTNPEGGTR